MWERGEGGGGEHPLTEPSQSLPVASVMSLTSQVVFGVPRLRYPSVAGIIVRPESPRRLSLAGHHQNSPRRCWSCALVTYMARLAK